MSNPSNRTFLILFLLIVGIVAVYLPRWQTTLTFAQSKEADAYTYVTDIDYWQRTKRERLVKTPYAFDLAHDLAEVPLEFGNWKGEERPQTNEDVLIMLDPDQYVRRLYKSDEGHYLWLSLIAGHGSRTFHPPEMCYDAHEWQTTLSSHAVELEDKSELYGLWLAAVRPSETQDDTSEQYNFYFYLYPNPTRAANEGIVLFKLTSSRYGSIEETQAIHEDFVRQLFSQTENLGG